MALRRAFGYVINSVKIQINRPKLSFKNSQPKLKIYKYIPHTFSYPNKSLREPNFEVSHRLSTLKNFIIEILFLGPLS